MKPYFETENGKLYHGDCLEILPHIEQVDLILTDPPYGIGEASGKNKSRSKLSKAKDYGNKGWDNKIPDAAVFELMKEKSIHQIIFGGNYFVKYLENSPSWIVWDKRNGKSDFADCELAYTNFKSAVRMFSYRWAGMLQECGGTHKEKRYHPTQKPAGLFKQILLKYSEKGQTILDPYAGSGTTALACEELGGYQWILIEQEKEYCDIIVKRIEQQTSQLKLPGF